MSKIFFTGDTHFFHKNIALYCNRPIWYDGDVLGPPIPGWMETNEAKKGMNELLIRRWNERIGPTDLVYHLGDFAFCGLQKFEEILQQLNGVIHWIKGNHDYSLAKKDNIQRRFEWIRDYYLLKVHDVHESEDSDELQQYHQPIVLCHFPILSWDGMAHGSWHLHGHCHGSLPPTRMMRMDVGVDTNNLYPYEYEDIKKVMVMRSVVPVDQHGV